MLARHNPMWVPKFLLCRSQQSDAHQLDPGSKGHTGLYLKSAPKGPQGSYPEALFQDEPAWDNFPPRQNSPQTILYPESHRLWKGLPLVYSFQALIQLLNRFEHFTISHCWFTNWPLYMSWGRGMGEDKERLKKKAGLSSLVGGRFNK